MVAETTLAPDFIVRAAAWPMQALEGFGAGEVECLSSLDRTEREEAYDRLIDRERRLLYSRTTGDPRFCRALAVVNPELASRAARVNLEVVRNKRVRHLETTLFRYLSRAATRTSPCGLWAGVARGRFEAADRIVGQRGRASFQPDLNPFVQIFEGVLKARRHESAVRLNPSAALDELTVRFKTPKGRVRQVRLAARASRVLSALARAGVASLEHHGETLQREFPALSQRTARELVRQLLDCELLIDTVAFPRQFSDAWQALERAAPLLPSDVAERWRAAVAEVRASCETLAGECDTIEPSVLVATLEKARRVIVSLGKGLGVDVDVPRSPLRVDWLHAYEVELGPRSTDRVRRALEDYWRYQMRYAPGPALLHMSRSLVVEAVRDGRPFEQLGIRDGVESRLSLSATWEALVEQTRDQAALRARIRHTSDLLASDVAVVQVPREFVFGMEELETPPLCGFVVGVDLDRLGEARLRAITGQTPCPFTLYSRFAALMEPRALNQCRLFRWLRGHFDRGPNAQGARAVELVSLASDEPNTLSRPDFELPVLDLYHPEDSGGCVGNLRVRGGRLTVDPAGRPLAAFWLPSGTVADASIEALATSTGQPLPEFRFEANAVAYEVELARGRAPRVELGDGVAIRARRHVLSAEEVREMLAPSERAERFIRWLRHAAKHEYPDLVRVRMSDRSAMVVPTRSALAIEALFEGLQRNVEDGWLIIESLETSSCIQLSDGLHYACEFVIFAERLGSKWYGNTA